MQTWILIAVAVLVTVVLYLIFQRKQQPAAPPAPLQQEPTPTPPAPATGVAKQRQAVEVTDQELEMYLQDPKIPSVVLLYSPGCGHCQAMAGDYEKYGQVAGTNVHILKIDCAKYFNVADKYKVQGFPTIKLFKGGQEAGEYNGDRKVGSLLAFQSGN